MKYLWRFRTLADRRKFYDACDRLHQMMFGRVDHPNCHCYANGSLQQAADAAADNAASDPFIGVVDAAEKIANGK